MKTKLLIVLLLTASSATTQASLFSRAGGTMIYDDVLNVTWLQDANYAQTSSFDKDGLMTWDNAVAWADGLNFGGFDDWRLPSFTGATTCSGFNCADSEYGHMFYNNMGASSFNSILTGSNVANLALFRNIQDIEYWSGVESATHPFLSWRFRTQNGLQGRNGKGFQYYAWAVRSGDVTAVPVPTAFWLFSSALIGLVVLNRKR